MAYLCITPRGPDDPSYFTVEEWVQTLPRLMDEVNNEFGNEVRLLTDFNASPIMIELKNPMMDTTGYNAVADKLFEADRYRYQYWIDN